MTDLEAHVAQDGRDELVRQVRHKIDELGITYIYYQFVSVTGRIVGKGVPIGAQMIVIAVAGLTMFGLVNREGVDTSAAFGVTLHSVFPRVSEMFA